ncbi:hypothetical protein OPW07_24235 [Vibrio europaeus]|uniref:hypothetical protein n=1 Tax=Vibrio europaeus TaxID=300876 RepID=UPI0018A6F677|nr:hypothetical protein [Vibrio europaeus]MDC5812833.1 hypothetical protein [Vibrio europaeus]QPG37627.1 hypothetical protein IXK98_15070 [Vibrio europaeus]
MSKETRYYERNKNQINEQRKQKRDYMLFCEFLADEEQKQEALFLNECCANTIFNREEIQRLYSDFSRLNESETLKIKQNKRLMQRFMMFLKAHEEHQEATTKKIVQQELNRLSKKKKPTIKKMVSKAATSALVAKLGKGKK